MLTKKSKKIFSGQFSFCLMLFLIAFCWILIPSYFLPAEDIDIILKGAKKYSDGEILSIKEQFRKAEIESIPLAFLIPRLKEGLAKQIPASRLQAALDKEIELCVKARIFLLDIEPALVMNNLVWQRTVHFLAWGATREELIAILRACLNRLDAYQEATTLFISLIKWGIARDLSVVLVTTVTKSALPERHWAGLLEILVKGRRLLLTPEKLIGRIIIQLPHIKTIHELEEKVLHE
jgi:hypothetical protein